MERGANACHRVRISGTLRQVAHLCLILKIDSFFFHAISRAAERMASERFVKLDDLEELLREAEDAQVSNLLLHYVCWHDGSFFKLHHKTKLFRFMGSYGICTVWNKIKDFQQVLLRTQNLSWINFFVLVLMVVV